MAEDSWLLKALTTVKVAGFNSKEARTVQWQILEVDRAGHYGISDGNRQGPIDALASCLDIVREASGCKKMHVGDAVQWLRNKGKPELATDLRKASLPELSLTLLRELTSLAKLDQTTTPDVVLKQTSATKKEVRQDSQIKEFKAALDETRHLTQKEHETEGMINLKNELNTKLNMKVDIVAWEEAKNDLDAAIKTMRASVSSLRLDVDTRSRQVDEVLASLRHDITAAETNLEESKEKITMDTGQVIDALHGRIDLNNKDLAATQERLHSTRISLSDCSKDVAAARSELEQNIAEVEARTCEHIINCFDFFENAGKDKSKGGNHWR